MKSIFNVDKKEWKKLEKQFRKSYIYKQYLIEFFTGVIILSFLSGFLIGRVSGLDFIDKGIIEMLKSLGFLIFFGFIALLSVLFAFKRLELIKQYYEETKKEK